MGQQNKKQEKEEEIDFVSEFLQDNQHTKIEQKMSEAYRFSSLDRQKQIKQHTEQLKDIEQQSLFFTENDFRLSKGSSMKDKKEEETYKIEGILEKQSPSLMGSWDERYCILTPNQFVYREKNMRESPEAGILNFHLLSCYIIVEQKKSQILSFKICIHESEKQFVFRGENPKVTKRWSDALNQYIDKSLGKMYKLNYLAHYHRFWRKDYISEAEFRATAQTGDIILMRGTKNSAVIQRAITGQEFDHMAFVLKNLKNDVLLFEASGGVGVGIIPWKKFIKRGWYKDQDIVVTRKLNINRAEEFYEEIEKFVERNMGRKYKFSVRNYIANRSSTSQDKKNYFCSSLVAKIYKNLELLNEKKSSTQYLPHSFSQKQALALKKTGKYGYAYLEKEKIIVFQKQFFQTND